MGYALDAFQEFGKDETITATGNAPKTLDHGNDRNIGIGEPLAMLLAVKSADGGNSDETYTADLQTSSTSDFSSDVVSLGTVEIPRDTTNTSFVHFIPKDFRSKRHMRLRFTLAGTSPSLEYDAHVLPANMIDAWTSYPAGYTIQRSTG